MAKAQFQGPLANMKPDALRFCVDASSPSSSNAASRRQLAANSPPFSNEQLTDALQDWTLAIHRTAKQAREDSSCLIFCYLMSLPVTIDLHHSRTLGRHCRECCSIILLAGFTCQAWIVFAGYLVHGSPRLFLFFSGCPVLLYIGRTVLCGRNLNPALCFTWPGPCFCCRGVMGLAAVGVHLALGVATIVVVIPRQMFEVCKAVWFQSRYSAQASVVSGESSVLERDQS
jgi:hypothetical protein